MKCKNNNINNNNNNNKLILISYFFSPASVFFELTSFRKLHHILASIFKCHFWSHCISQGTPVADFSTPLRQVLRCWDKVSNKGWICLKEPEAAAVHSSPAWLNLSPQSNTYYKIASAGREVNCKLFIHLKWFQDSLWKCLIIDILPNVGRANLRGSHWGNMQENLSFPYLSLSEMSICMFVL